jgi:hypothetical protein
LDIGSSLSGLGIGAPSLYWMRKQKYLSKEEKKKRRKKRIVGRPFLGSS